MSNELEPKSTPSQPVVYQIRLKGHLDSQWTDWFDGLTITLEEDGDTLLTGPLVDQSALHGLLKKVRDQGMPLVSVSQVQSNETHSYRSKKEKEMNSLNKTARMAGFLYLIYMVVSIFPDVGVRSKLIVLGDAATTARNIMASALQFRIGFVVDLVGALLFLLTAWALYVLLKPVNKNIALLFLLLNLGGVAVWCFSDLFLIASQLLLSGADYLKVFQSDQLQALSMACLYIYKNGFSGISQIFFSAWLFPLGYLVFKSGFLPRILGIVLMVECFGWLLFPIQFFFFPGNLVLFYLSSAVGFIGEFSLMLWLLIMGAKDQKPA